MDSALTLNVSTPKFLVNLGGGVMRGGPINVELLKAEGAQEISFWRLSAKPGFPRSAAERGGTRAESAATVWEQHAETDAAGGHAEAMWVELVRRKPRGCHPLRES